MVAYTEDMVSLKLNIIDTFPKQANNDDPLRNMYSLSV